MSYRSVGRAHDWDIEKYRKSGKGADKGNRRRFMKNVARIIKNPLGYVYWKFNGGKTNVTFLPLFVFGSFATYVYFYAMRARQEK